MSSKNKLLIFIIVTPLLLIMAGGLYLKQNLFSAYSGKDTHFHLSPGEGFASINYRLKNKKIIPSARLFHYYTKFTDRINAMKAGTYLIKTGSTPVEVLDTLTNGVPILTKVTIPEGKNMYEIGKLLEDAQITSYDEFIKLCRSDEFIQSLDINAPSIEGYLFPETYLFAPETPAKEVIQLMLKEFKKQTSKLSFYHDLLSPHQVIILASIVEKETGAKWERPTIAGVYLNRLRKKMRLQADPTTIYGIWENYDGNLKKKHLLEKTPYNTYRINGLPLGPIANPSLAAIKAVLNPKEHNYIYFVSKNDGTHIFTSTYKEHLKAVDFWQRNAKNRKGKSWRDLKQK